MAQSNSTPANDNDGAWKEAFTEYLEPFFAFCFPAVHADIDWSRGFEFLDKELQKIIPQSETGRRRPVASFVVLADDNPKWKPDHFSSNLWGCKVDFSFPTVKLTDLAADSARLEQSDNPFAVIILAHIRAMQTTGDPSRRRVEKVRLIKSLYDRWGRDEVRKLVRLIDWLVMLPKELESQLMDEIEIFEQEKKMPYITSFERVGEARGEVRGEARGEARGIQNGIALGLKLKFGEAGASLANEVRQISDLDLLRRIFESIERSDDIADIRRISTEHKN